VLVDPGGDRTDMMTITVDQKDIDRLHRRLGSAAANKTMRPPVGRGQDRLLRRFSGYDQNTPLKPPGSTYERTFTIARSWKKERIKTTAQGVSGKVGSNRAAPVMSYLDQVPLHRGRWYTDRSVIRDEEPEIMRDMKRAIDKALSR